MDDQEKRKRDVDPWREALVQNLEKVVGSDTRRVVVMDNDLGKEHTCEENLMWTSETMRRLDEVLEEGDRIRC